MKKKTTGYEIEVSKQIRKLLLDALKKKSWYFFKNPQLCKCWEEMNCKNTQCPSYKSSNLRCWQISGTFCKGEPQGEFAKKLKDCHKCKVYKKATAGNAILQIGEDFNNLMFHLKTKEDELKQIIQEYNEKNKALEASNREIKKLLEKLDSKNILLRELSIKDALTGLYNYRFFREILNEQFNMAKRYKFPISCIMIDIDFFKAINDTYGHQHGDAVLRQLADILKNNVRETDRVVRYGGEEFAILFPYTDSKDAYIKAERLRELVNNYTFEVGKEKLGITISLGIATYPINKNINRPDQLVSCADRALYQAKERGRNQSVLFVDETGTRMPDKKTAKQRSVIERRNYPRIQVLLKVKGRMQNKEIFSSNTFDISCSGMSLLSQTPIVSNKALEIRLYLPDMDKKGKRTIQIDLEGIAVWCRQIHDVSGIYAGSKQCPKAIYLVGIQFTDVPEKAWKTLREYFISIFQRENR